MPTNLRSLPIEGYITDNAGNIVRNADVIIKEDAPNGSIVVDTAKSDDDGYFISRPIKNGVYDIYESGLRVMRQYHSSNPTLIQCYNPETNNIPTNIRPFNDFIGSPTPSYDINKARVYVQVEPEYIDISTYGHMFPVWNIDPQADLYGHDFYNITAIHPELTTASSSKLTHTRFDVEFFLPLYAQNTSHRRIRWSGVPGAIFYADSRVVLPLDYYSIVANHHYVQYTPIADNMWSVWNGDPELISVNLTTDSMLAIYDKATNGDILELQMSGGYKFWCILYCKQTTSVTDSQRTGQMYGRLWKAADGRLIAQGTSDLTYLKALVPNMKVVGYKIFQGMFSALSNVTTSTSEYFSVQENQNAQNSINEAYNYNRI